MRRFFLVTCLVAVLLQEVLVNPAPQVPVKTKGQHEAPEQDLEKAWDIQAVKTLEKEGLPAMPALNLAVIKEKHPGTKTWVETEDILGRFRSPQQVPEPDLDSLYHPALEEEVQGKERPWLPAMLPRQVFQGPEEDLDHIYHPVEDVREP